MSRTFTVAVLVVFAIVLSANAFAVELITNGGFETGDFTGWTTANQPGGYSRWWIGGPGNTPVSGWPSVGPASGNYYAVTDGDYGGCSVLYQMVTVPSSGTVTVSFDMFVNNWAYGPYINGLDYTVVPNRHCRVDVLQPNADPFSTAPADIIQTYFLGGDPVTAPDPYTHYSSTASGVSPGTYMLRFGEVENQTAFDGGPGLYFEYYFNQGVDNVSADFTPGNQVPEPSSLLFLLTALPFGLRLRRK